MKRFAALRVVYACLVGTLVCACSSSLGDGAAPKQSEINDGSISPEVKSDANMPTTGDGGTAPAPSPYPVCSTDDVCIALPFPLGDDLHAAFASSRSEVYIVGDRGAFLRLKGQEFLDLKSDTDADLLALDGDNSGRLWAVGERATILESDTTTVKAHDVRELLGVSAGETTLRGVLAVTPTLVFVAGEGPEGPILLRYDGHVFTAMDSEPLTGHSVRAMFAFAADDIWLVGMAGSIWHYDGVALSAHESPTAANLHAVVGRSDGELWVAGEGATVLRYDGEVFVAVPSPATGTATAIVIDGENEVSPIDEDGGLPGLDSGVEGHPRVHVLHGDGTVMRFDGTAMVPAIARRSRGLLSAARLGNDDFLAVGEGGLVERFAAGGSATLSRGTQRNYLSLARAPLGGLLLLGDTGMLLTGDVARPLELPTKRSLFGVDVDGEDVWAVGTAGTLLHMRELESEATYPPALLGQFLRGVAAVDGVLYVVGNSGFAAVRAIDGSWTQLETGVTENLHAVWAKTTSSTWIAGDNGTLLRVVDGQVQSIPAGPHGQESSASLRAIDGDGHDLWFVGSQGTVLRWNGSGVMVQDTAGGYTLNAVHIVGPDDIHAVGSGGTWLHYDGLSWQALAVPTRASLQAVTSGSEGVLAVGLSGTLLRRANR